MASKIVVPDLGESITEATVLRWIKKEGDTVALGDVLLELETDKVNVEVGSEHAGILTHIAHREGEDVKIGDELGTIDEAGVAVAKPSSVAPGSPAEPPAKKAAEKKTSESTGVKPIKEITPGRKNEPPTSAPEAKPVAPEARPSASTPAPARDQDPAIFAPPSPPAPVMESRAAKERESAPAKDAQQPPPMAMGQMATRPERREAPGREEHIPLSRRRRTIAERLVEAKQTTAMLTTFNEVDMSKVMDLRQRFKESFSSRHRVGLGIMPFFVKAATSSLRAHPMLNAEIRGNEIILKHFHDIGIAIDIGDGLVVPTLRNADTMTFAQVEEAIREYARKAREGELELNDLRGGSFTITNGGVFGSLLSTPILNPPQVGILGLHKIQERAVVIGGQIVVRPMMYTALSYDHRLIDGREAVGFLITLKEFIENPEELLLEG